MKIEDLEQLATRGDLENLQTTLLLKFKEIIRQSSMKEFYNTREFAEITGMGYSNVVKYCQTGKIKARQDGTRGSWVISRDEVDKFIQQAQENLYDA